MKKVLHLTLYLDIGGLERMVWMLCREQKALGWMPAVFVYERGSGDLLPHFEHEQIPVTFCPKGKGFSPHLLFRILSHLRHHEITMIHSHDLGALIYATLVKLLSGAQIRVIHTQHSFQHLRSKKLRLYERIFPWLADRLVCVSEDLRRTYLTLGQPLERLRIVPNGVDFHVKVMEKEPTRAHLLAAHGLPAHLREKKWIVCLGRLAQIKGPQHALSAWNLVSKESTRNAVLLFVGPETEPELAKNLRQSAGTEVIFTGPSLEPTSWLAAADLFFSGSEFEGLPMAGLEAAACRLPMLLSQIPGHSLFRGWAAYFPISEPMVAAHLLECFLKTGRLAENTLAPATLERLKRGCGVERMTKRYLHLYQELQ